MLAQFFGAFDRVVIGEGEEIHAAALQERIDFCGIAITFAAKLSDKRSRAGPGEVRVDMQVALHVNKNSGAVLPADDKRAKVLKIQVFNSYSTQ